MGGGPLCQLNVFSMTLRKLVRKRFVWEMEKCSTNLMLLLLLTQISNLNAFHNIGKWFLKYTELHEETFQFLRDMLQEAVEDEESKKLLMDSLCQKFHRINRRVNGFKLQFISPHLKGIKDYTN